MKKLIAIGLMLMLVAIVAACTGNLYQEKIVDGSQIVDDGETGDDDLESVGDPVLDTIEEEPEEVVDDEELDGVIDDIGMDDW